MYWNSSHFLNFHLFDSQKKLFADCWRNLISVGDSLITPLQVSLDPFVAHWHFKRSKKKRRVKCVLNAELNPQRPNRLEQPLPFSLGLTASTSFTLLPKKLLSNVKICCHRVFCICSRMNLTVNLAMFQRFLHSFLRRRWLKVFRNSLCFTLRNYYFNVRSLNSVALHVTCLHWCGIWRIMVVFLVPRFSTFKTPSHFGGRNPISWAQSEMMTAPSWSLAEAWSLIWYSSKRQSVSNNPHFSHFWTHELYYFWMLRASDFSFFHFLQLFFLHTHINFVLPIISHLFQFFDFC